MKHYPTLELGKDVQPAFKTCKIFRMAIEAMICSKLKLKDRLNRRILKVYKIYSVCPVIALIILIFLTGYINRTLKNTTVDTK